MINKKGTTTMSEQLPESTTNETVEQPTRLTRTEAYIARTGISGKELVTNLDQAEAEARAVTNDQYM